MAHISISNLSAQYRVYGAKSRSLKLRMISQATGGKLLANHDDSVVVKAIDNISLEIADGERIGLVGHNGSGKTTLLRVLAGIYKPSAGQARITGRLSALLNPASGMDQESTGIENIFLRGYLMGLTKAEIDAHVDEICAFSELGEYVHLPVRTYSAGMFARLAFSISTILRSDIMLIDEGIGAGDAAFFSRAQQKIETMLESTSIVILASHAPSLINRFCNRLIRMDSGRIIEDGPVVPE